MPRPKPPKTADEVKESDPCQPVRKQKGKDAFTVVCKGKKCSADVECKKLQKKKWRSPHAPWEEADSDGLEVYDPDYEYRCCERTLD